MSVGTAAARPWRQARATLDRRFWVVALGGSFVTLLILGIPTAVIPNPFFVRMTPVEPFSFATWILSALLSGPLIATYVAPPSGSQIDQGEGRARASVAGVAAYLAIGCPICNKIIVAVLGLSGALTVFAPVQPFLGAASITLLALTLAWRLRLRGARCGACVNAIQAQPAA